MSVDPFVARLERWLGDSDHFTLDACMARDEAEAYPDEACQALHGFGLTEQYIPAAFGGALASYETLGWALRLLSRRDLTVVITHFKSFVGSIHHWVAGTPAQVEAMSARLRRGERVALAYHEAKHGSDHLAGETRADAVEGGFRLFGEKWCVNNATKGAAATVFARTAPGGGPRGFSIFLVDKAKVNGAVRAHSPLKTNGMRGADFSALTFDGAFVPQAELVGGLGAGHEIAMLSFQVTRTLMPFLSLGSADTALRATAAFARSRTVYGKHVTQIAPARRELAQAFARLLLVEAVGAFTARAVHALTPHLRLLASASKAFMCETADAVIAQLAPILGARSYFREGHWGGVFQKVARDQAIVGIFHAGGFTNLQTVGMFLVADAQRSLEAPEDDAVEAAVDVSADLLGPLPAVKLEQLALAGRLGNPVLRGLARLEAGVAAAVVQGAVPELETCVRALRRRVSSFAEEVLRTSAARGPAFGASAELHELAREHTRLHAAAIALRTFVRCRARLAPVFDAGAHVALGVAGLLGELNAWSPARRDALEEACVAALIRRVDENRLLSAFDFQLARFGPDAALVP
jgi:alkylation response protein AidB-like acyl-CoA dehydrogenase